MNMPSNEVLVELTTKTVEAYLASLGALTTQQRQVCLRALVNRCEFKIMKLATEH